MIPRHPHRTHASQLTKARRRACAARNSRAKERKTRHDKEKTGAESPGVFALFAFILKRWCK